MERIVLFDGVCNFCNGAVNFIIRHDPEKRFRFAPLQSEMGQELKAKYAIDDNVDSIIYIEDGTAYIHSTAGLRIAKAIGGIWAIAAIFLVVPRPIRDWCYKLFARNRYRLFGRRDMCMLPTPDVRERFLAEPPAIAGG